MIRNEFYEGILYQIEYKPELSNNDYTQHKVYYIKTEEENYTKAHTAIKSIMNDGSWTVGEYKIKNKQNPNMLNALLNALHTYHKFSYNEDLDVYVYTFVKPYDD